MAKGRDSNAVSVWFWLISMVVMAIPLVNIVMTLVWAFSGENESRKNYFKAVIIMFFVVVALVALLATAGMIPILLEDMRKLPR
jgi:bacteriorhodopsin